VTVGGRAVRSWRTLLQQAFAEHGAFQRDCRTSGMIASNYALPPPAAGATIVATERGRNER
jgi:aerobic-type carbon monoxide dehydrogenase small subunit (CoxS/CutS family)